LTILSSLPDHLVEHVRGLGHLGGVENQVDVVVLRRDRGLERETSMTGKFGCPRKKKKKLHFGLNVLLLLKFSHVGYYQLFCCLKTFSCMKLRAYVFFKHNSIFFSFVITLKEQGTYSQNLIYEWARQARVLHYTKLVRFVRYKH
jgi:hypothetical protein